MVKISYCTVMDRICDPAQAQVFIEQEGQSKKVKQITFFTFRVLRKHIRGKYTFLPSEFLGNTPLLTSRAGHMCTFPDCCEVTDDIRHLSVT